MQPISSYECATKVEPSLYFGGPLAWLHNLAWGNDPQNFFRTVDVHRDTNAMRVDAQVPPTITTLGWMGDSTLLAIYEISSIFVRDDYLAILKEITGTNYRETRNSGSVYNPFKKRMQRPSRNDAGAVVIGNPGIGKSTFLIYVLVLRLLASQTTILQRTANEFFVMASEGVFRVSPPTTDGLNFHIPKETWVLIDSNSSIMEVPLHFIDLRKVHHCFILQAASPRAARIQWTKKVGKTEEYWMAPWTLGELIAGRQLQLETNARYPSESQIASFYEKYGASANTTYAHAAHTLAFERKLRSQLNVLSADALHKMLTSPTTVALEETISHLLITIKPSLESHLDYSLEISTRWITDLILDYLRHLEKNTAQRLCFLFLSNSYTRAGAGYLLERAVLEAFPNGGQWSIQRMERTNARSNTRWTVGNNATVCYLMLGHQPSAVEIADAMADPLDRFELSRRLLPSTGQVICQSGFFIPTSSNQPSFDAFVFDMNKKHAVLFQMTVSPKHDIKRSELVKLQQSLPEDTSIDLVVVTCPKEFAGANTITMRKEDLDNNTIVTNVYLLEFGLE